MDVIDRLFIEPFKEFFDKVVRYLPNFFTAVLILIVGCAVGLLVKWVLHRVLKGIGFDVLSGKIGVAELLRKAGINESLSLLLARLVGGLLILIFAVISALALDIPATENLFEKFVLYLPNIFAAALILILGYVLGNFLGRATLIASVNAGLRASGLLGRLVKMAVFITMLTMALEQLGIGRETIVIAFSIVFGGVVLALALALGLGGQEIAKRYLEKRFEGEKEKDDFRHI
jgi:hypothetical protein